MLTEKKAIIAGGGRGIGKAIAKAFVGAGAEVLLVARNKTDLEAAQKELSPLGRVEVISADVSLETDSAAVAQKAYDLWGRLDILVNAAGVYGPIGPLAEANVAEWRKAIDINLFGTFLMMRATVPLMKKSGRGKIVNFSGGGEGAYANFAAYAASKGAVVRLTETAAEELKSFNIEVNAIAPGAVNTKLLDDLLKAGPEKAGEETYKRSLEQKASGGVPPEKAAELAVFLASDAANGISGRIISAIRDDYRNFPSRLKEIMESDIYTWRRIKPQDRGYNW
ncbi:MAG: SDR family oxidoreductase [Parcubacteria group bacterium]|nr:SDR family oxidoreductase [Parcubacteria group bacterium]